MPAGRPPKPLEQKRRLGNPGKRPLPEPITVLAPSEPAATRAAFADGRALLQHVLDNGASAWIGPTDVAADILVVLYDDWLRAREAWLVSGFKDDFKAYDAITGRLQVCLSTLGLNPSDRGRLGLAEVQAKATGLSALREARASKAGRRAG
jgi:hypothetical protein